MSNSLYVIFSFIFFILIHTSSCFSVLSGLEIREIERHLNHHYPARPIAFSDDQLPPLNKIQKYILKGSQKIEIISNYDMSNREFLFASATVGYDKPLSETSFLYWISNTLNQLIAAVLYHSHEGQDETSPTEEIIEDDETSMDR